MKYDKLLAENEKLKQRVNELTRLYLEWQQLSGILQIEYGEDLPTGDILIRVRPNLMSKEITHKDCEFFVRKP